MFRRQYFIPNGAIRFDFPHGLNPFDYDRKQTHTSRARRRDSQAGSAPSARNEEAHGQSTADNVEQSARPAHPKSQTEEARKVAALSGAGLSACRPVGSDYALLSLSCIQFPPIRLSRSGGAVYRHGPPSRHFRAPAWIACHASTTPF